MRKLFLTITVSLFALGLQQEAFAGFANVWSCAATLTSDTSGNGPVYLGYSKLFPPGSGQGRQARMQALQKAKETCQQSAKKRCQSDLMDCEVNQYLVKGPILMGKWIQANLQSCRSACSRNGLKPASTPAGGKCASGEIRPATAINQGIKFTYGCWPNCSPQVKVASDSVGGFCYAPGQKRDYHRTDRTVACFCK